MALLRPFSAVFFHFWGVPWGCLGVFMGIQPSYIHPIPQLPKKTACRCLTQIGLAKPIWVRQRQVVFPVFQAWVGCNQSIPMKTPRKHTGTPQKWMKTASKGPFLASRDHVKGLMRPTPRLLSSVVATLMFKYFYVLQFEVMMGRDSPITFIIISYSHTNV